MRPVVIRSLGQSCYFTLIPPFTRQCIIMVIQKSGSRSLQGRAIELKRYKLLKQLPNNEENSKTVHSDKSATAGAWSCQGDHSDLVNLRLPSLVGFCGCQRPWASPTERTIIKIRRGISPPRCSINLDLSCCDGLTVLLSYWDQARSCAKGSSCCRIGYYSL